MNVKKTIGALLGAGALVFALAGTSLAQDGNQTDVDYNFAASDCTGGPNGDIVVPDGQVAWVFVHAGVDTSLTGELTAIFDNAGTQNADSYVQGNLKYLIITDIPDTLQSFSDDIDGGVLTLSHTCYGSETSSSSSSSSSTSSSSSSSSTSFTGSTGGASTTSSLPETSVLGNTSGPTDHSWMLIAALGMLLGSALVLAPARAKNRR